MKQQRNFICGLALLVLIGGFGCSSAPKAGSPDQPSTGTNGEQVYGPGGEVFGPPEAPQQPAYGPEPLQLRPLILVLGPGGARGFAYVGALRAIAEAKIPISSIYGTDIGALFGALYAMSGSLNHFEWGLLRFPDEVFEPGKSILNPFGKRADAKKLEAALSKAFGDKDLRTSRIPMRVGLHLREKDRLITVSEGLAKRALRAALATPGGFEAGEWEGQEADSALKVRPFLVSEARGGSHGAVVVIDASGDPKVAELPELKDADFVLRPDMKGIGPADFSKRTEAALRGKKEVKSHLAELKHLVGLPPNEGVGQ